MYTNKPEYLSCSPDIVGGLIETACTALMDNFPSTNDVDRNDVAMVLDALHVLRPDAPELDALDGIHCIVSGSYDDAIRILRQVTERAPRFAYARALLAFSLAAKGDPEWQQCAGEVMGDEASFDAQPLVRVLVARHDLLMARRTSSLGGEFEVPDSVKSFLAEYATPLAPEAAAMASEAKPIDQREPVATNEHHQSGFLRA